MQLYELFAPEDYVPVFDDDGQLVPYAYIVPEEKGTETRTATATPATVHVTTPAKVEVGRSFEQLLDEVPEEPDWIIPGVIAPGWTLKLAGREKSGKGTLVHYLLGALERGEETIFGKSKQTTALVLTEEPEESVREKAEAFGLKGGRLIFGWELSQLPWWSKNEPCKVTHLIDTATQEGCALIFVDNVSRAAGVEDESGVELARAVERLSEACKTAGIALIIDHHHRKARGRTEDLSRGGTGTGGATEANIELEVVGNAYTSRKRKLSSRGRMRATVWQRVIELSEDGRSYTSTDADAEPETQRGDAEDALLLSLMQVKGAVGGRAFGVAEYERLAGVSRRTAQRKLADMVEREWLTKYDPGRDENGRRLPTSYQVVRRD